MRIMGKKRTAFFQRTSVRYGRRMGRVNIIKLNGAEIDNEVSAIRSRFLELGNDNGRRDGGCVGGCRRFWVFMR